MFNRHKKATEQKRGGFGAGLVASFAKIFATMGKKTGFKLPPTWKPKFSGSELSTGRSISHRGDRTRFFRALRTKYYELTDEGSRTLPDKWLGKNYLYL